MHTKTFLYPYDYTAIFILLQTKLTHLLIFLSTQHLILNIHYPCLLLNWVTQWNSQLNHITYSSLLLVTNLPKNIVDIRNHRNELIVKWILGLEKNRSICEHRISVLTCCQISCVHLSKPRTYPNLTIRGKVQTYSSITKQMICINRQDIK